MPLTLTDIDIGSAPGDRSGDPGRTAFDITNTNMALIAATIEDAELKAFVVGCTPKGEDCVVVDDVEHFFMPYAFVLVDVQAGVETAPTGADLIVDVNEDAVSVLPTGGLAIAAGTKTGEEVIDSYIILEKGAEMTIDVTQIGSTIAGQWLKVTLVGYIIETSF